MPQLQSLTNTYCNLDDVLVELNKTDQPDSIFQSRIHNSIIEASRLIDDYCLAKFYEQDYSGYYYDLRYEEHVKDTSNIFLFVPISAITEISEDDSVLSSSNYRVVNNKILRLDDDGDLINWGSKIKLKGKLGYKTPNNLSTGYLTLPSLIRSQCAVFATYLMGERKVGEKIKTSSETGNRVQSLGNNWKLGTAMSMGGASTGQPEVAGEVYTMELKNIQYSGYTYSWNNQGKVATGIKVPIERSTTEIENSGFDGLVPDFEYKKLDPYRFLRI